MDLEYTQKVLVSKIHSESFYDVWIVKMPDMDIETYGVVNRETGVIENLQPNIFNAKALAYQFSKWLEGGMEQEIDIAAILKGASDAPLN
jgi:hypothetical protein